MSSIDKNWLDSKIFWLTAVLNIDEILFYSNFSLTGNLYEYFESGKITDVQKAIDAVCKNFNIIPPNAKYDWDEELGNDDHKKGHISLGQIVISLEFTSDKFLLAATAFHELMHYILIYRNKINLPDNLENEKITDIAVIVIGLCKIMLNGKVISKDNNNIQSLGYLNFEELSYAYSKITILRNVFDKNFLTPNAFRILNGTIDKNFNLNASSSDTEVFFEGLSIFFRGIKSLLSKLLKYIKNVCDKFINKTRCPFCNKSIPNVSEKCKFCLRIIRESLK